MSDGDINELIEQLNSIRVEREEAVRIIGRTNRQEAQIISDLQALQRTRRRRETTDANANHEPIRSNEFRIGQLVEITNRLRDEFGITGVVTSVGHTRVELKNSTTERKYSRAHWNLRLVPQSEESQ